MMTDRELLELAAKAMGYETRWDQPRGSSIGWLRRNVGQRGWPMWNPLNDDAEAFRLAVSLELHIEFMHDVHVMGCAEGGGNRLAATRRAIVRAAAEIGKAMP